MMKAVAHATLMTNRVPGVALPARHRLRTAYSSGHAPLLFSLDERFRFRLTLPAAGTSTGWTEMDLTERLATRPELGPAAVVRSFALSQGLDGTLRLVVAAVPAPGGPTHVYVSEALPNSESVDDWAALPALVRSHAVLPDLDVVDIVIGGGPGETPFGVVAGVDPAGQVRYHQINPDPAGTWSALPLPLPQNATRMLALAVGRHPKLGRGVYSLLELASLHSLVFSTLPRVEKGRTIINTVELDLPEGLAPRCLATVADTRGRTALYVAGNGVHHYPVEAQASSHLPGEWLLEPGTATGIRDLQVAADQLTEQLSIWAMDDRDTLVHMEGFRESDKQPYKWQPPITVDTEVTALSAYRVRTSAAPDASGVTMAVGGSDGSFRLVQRDPVTALWQRRVVALHSDDDALPVPAYTVRVVVTDDAAAPVAGATVTVEPARDCPALVNGSYYALRAGTAKPATTDSLGALTVVVDTPDLTVPSLTFRVGDAPVLTVDPGEDAKAVLRTLSSGEAIATAVRSDDRPLFATAPDPAACEAAAIAVTRLMAAHDQLAARHSPAGVARSAAITTGPVAVVGTASPITLVRAASGGWRLAEPQRPGTGPLTRSAGVGAAGTEGILVAAGELLAAAHAEARHLRRFVIDQVEAGCQLVVEIGDQVLRCVLALPHQAIAAIDQVLRRTLGITIEEIVALIGFAFNWPAVLTNHRVIVKTVTLSLDHMIHQLASTKTSIDDRFAEIRKMFVDDRLVVDRSDDIFAERVGRHRPEAVPAEHRRSVQDPQAHWVVNQFTHHVRRAKVDPFVPDDLETVLEGLGEDEVAVVMQAAQQVGTLLGGDLAGRSVGEILTAIVDIVAVAVLDTLENVTLTVVDLGIVMLSAIRKILTAHLRIPVLTFLYEKVICEDDGSSLTLLDLAALLAATPATIVGRAVTHRALLSPDQTAGVHSATDWDGLLAALAGPAHRVAVRDGVAATSARADAAAETTARVFHLFNAFLRWGSTAMGTIRDTTDMSQDAPVADDLKMIVNRCKIALDSIGYAVGLCATALLHSDSNRKKLDTTITALGFISPTLQVLSEVLRTQREARGPVPVVRLVPWEASEGEEPVPAVEPPPSQLGLDDLLRYLEAGNGLILTVLCTASFVMQLEELERDPQAKPELSPLLGFKYLQGLLSGLGSIAAVGLAKPAGDDPEVKAGAALLRLIFGLVRTDIQIGRSVTQLVDHVVDFEGVVP